MAITWADRLANLRKALGRAPTLEEMLDAAQIHQMTPEEVEAQRKSWVRGMTTPCEHGELDFEQCPKCVAKIGRGKLAQYATTLSVVMVRMPTRNRNEPQRNNRPIRFRFHHRQHHVSLVDFPAGVWVPALRCLLTPSLRTRTCTTGNRLRLPRRTEREY